MSTSQYRERKGIDAVQLAATEPRNGKEVIDYLFPLTEAGAKPLTLHRDCKKQMHEGIGSSGKTNDKSFDECFKLGGYDAAKPQLMAAAYQHGEISRLIQLLLDPESTQVSLKAHEAAGAAVRKMCTVTCAGALGQWCQWP